MIIYNRTTFVEPAAIDEGSYYYFKNQLAANQGFKLNNSKETFVGKYKRSFKFLGWGLPLFAILYGYDLHFKDTPYLPKIGLQVLLVMIVVLGFILCIVLAKLLLEGTSYAVYLHNKQHYFIGMEHAIQQSHHFNDFNQLFYGGLKDKAKYYKVRAKEAIAINKPTATLDSYFIGVFRMIDTLSYVLGAVVIVFAIKHYFFDK